MEDFLVQSASDYVYLPYYIAVFLILLGVLYPVLFALSLMTKVYTRIGYTLLALSMITYLLVGFYMVGVGYRSDYHTPDINIFAIFGFLELILLTYPYILLSLAIGLGKVTEE